ncbi:hypothetical protein VPNG_00133 [Cytospora leucostoma]|uniref:F-box domain-containing protein n=1 Tax=Cytospora leucostoma TaxID=1230097 RepID=A0A423XPG2_9PEZI|nr:hypothetical protein VPNG_00133 [Cytospora leucostoma]
MDLVDLPHDLFLLIVAHLSARTAVSCRRVSRSWNAAFTGEDLCLRLLRWHFPRCREARLAIAADVAVAAEGGCSGVRPGDGDGDGARGEHDGADEQGRRQSRGSRGMNGNDDVVAGRGRTDWAAVFADVASRYYHLRAAAPRSVQKIRHGAAAAAAAAHQGSWSGRFLPVGTWDRYLRLDDKTAPFHYPDPGWCYSQEDGLLVYHVYEGKGDVTRVDDGSAIDTCPWRLLDLETRREEIIPFPQGRDRVVRRVRLSDGVLIFEWCQREVDEQPLGQKEGRRHFVTAYDVRRITPALSAINEGTQDPRRDSNSGDWIITQRAQFPMQTPNIPITTRGRFFSAHTGTHYAVYIWQPPDRPGQGVDNDDHVDVVAIIWDISKAGRPRVLRRMDSPTLAFYGVRQQPAPSLRGLGLDDRNVYFVEEEHRWEQGGHGSPSPPRVHHVRSTGIPVITAPSGGVVVVDDDDDRMGHRPEAVQGPPWVDQCGANGDINMSFCSRTGSDYLQHDGRWDGRFPPQTAGTTRAATTPTTTTTTSSSSSGNGSGAGVPMTTTTTTTTPIREAEASALAPTGRWPGRAPCWRHEEFPYLTVSEMVDFRAGVRVTARHCFMLEALSVHVRPSLRIRGLGGLSSGSTTASEGEDGGKEGPRSGSGVGGGGGGGKTGGRRRGRGRGKSSRSFSRDGGKKAWSSGGHDGAAGGTDQEVQFADDMWGALLGKGYICGDERWLIGEDRGGAITVLRF